MANYQVMGVREVDALNEAGQLVTQAIITIKTTMGNTGTVKVPEVALDEANEEMLAVALQKKADDLDRPFKLAEQF